MTGQEARDDENRLPAHITEEDIALITRVVAPTIMAAMIAEGYRKHPEPEITEQVTKVVGVARGSEQWFTTSADGVLERLKTESTEDVMLYHDAVSVLVFARDLVRLVARVPVGEGEQPKPKATLVDERDAACVAAWPGCGSGEYDPRCCRFPKSCSAGIIRLVTPGEGEQG